MKKNVWVGIYVASFLLFVAALLFGGLIFLMVEDRVLEPGGITSIGLLIVLALMYLQFVIVQTIYVFKMLSRMWRSIQDGVTPITVGKAIGFLFIPIFSVYWMFVAWGGFPKHYNHYIDRHKLNAPHLSGGVYATLPVFILLTAIFWLPILAMPFVFAFLIAKTCDAVNLLKQAEENRLNNVQQPVRLEQAPKTKLVFATLGSLAVVSVLFLTAFSVFAYRNRNPKANGDETPEMVGKFKKEYSGLRGSTFGLRKEFYANYKLADGSKKDDGIRYELVDYWRENDAVSEFKQPWDSCSSNETKQEGAIKDKSGYQVGEFRICGDEKFYSRMGNRYVSLRGSYYKSSFKSGDLIQFFLNLPFNSQIDANGFSAAKTAPSSLPPLSDTKTENLKSTVAATDTADFVLTAEEFYKESDGASSKKNREKYADKIVEISGRVYRANFGANGEVGLYAGENTVSLKIADESRADADKLKQDERVVFKCRSGGSYRIELKSCLLTEAKGIISPDDKPDFIFTAKDFFKEVDGEQSVESAMKKREKYASKIIEITGRVQIISGKPHYLFVEDMDWISCKPDEENAGQFADLREGQEVTFKGLGSRYGAGLEHCIVISQ